MNTTGFIQNVHFLKLLWLIQVTNAYILEVLLVDSGGEIFDLILKYLSYLKYRKNHGRFDWWEKMPSYKTEYDFDE